MSEEKLTLKEMCAKFDVTPRTLRYYEYIELLFPEKQGRTRYYGAQEFVRMKYILRGRRFGFSLEEIRQWLEIYEKQGVKEQLTTWVEASGAQIKELVSRLVQLQETIDDLRELRQQAIEDLEKS